MPKATKFPFSAESIAALIDFKNCRLSFIKWSEAKTNRIGSEPFSTAFSAPSAIAGAVLRAKGSRMILFGFTLILLNCSATMKR